MLRIALALMLSLISVSASAQNGGYAGILIGSYKFYPDDLFTSDPKVIGLTFGYQFSKYDTVELRAAFSLGTRDEVLNVLDTDVDVKFEIENYYSILYKPAYQFDRISLYGLAGYTELTSRVRANEYNLDIKGTKSGPSYGGGISYIKSDKTRFNLEFLEVANTSTYSVRGINFTVQSFFR
jgi:opacity protein-like surface antigen